jgi:Mg2+ and Co2+ transporter CorA
MQASLSFIQLSSSETTIQNTFLAETARQGQKDSQKLQALTFIATLYLPATLVATIFSSTLVQWKEARQKYTLVSEFWIFVMCTVVLTVLTLVLIRLKEIRTWFKKMVKRV